jgi:hypothetical protein
MLLNRREADLNTSAISGIYWRYYSEIRFAEHSQIYWPGDEPVRANTCENLCCTNTNWLKSIR